MPGRTRKTKGRVTNDDGTWRPSKWPSARSAGRRKSIKKTPKRARPKAAAKGKPRVRGYVVVDPMGLSSSEPQVAQIVERFSLKGPIAERGEGELELEDGHSYPGGRVSKDKRREVYCVRFTRPGGVYATRLEEDFIRVITRDEAKKLHAEATGGDKLPSTGAMSHPPRCGHEL
tara:strand:- start:108 stop:629 length:522 start_codon:yes stop_codon:yes gene_type:complete